MYQRLYFHDVEPRREYHAAWVTRWTHGEGRAHDHDFWEWCLAVEGRGNHHINGENEVLTAGELRLIRPADRHAFSATGRFELLNVAFPAAPWEQFLREAAPSRAAEWKTTARPPCASLQEGGFREAFRVFEKALHLFQEPPQVPDTLVLHQLWSTLLPWLWPGSAEAEIYEEAPAWLSRSIHLMEKEENLRGGVDRMRELAAVSASHLARSVRLHTGKTPTDLVNELRLRHAARLLRTGNTSIPETAERCGFENLPYFYRLFGRMYGCTPLVYRHGAQRAVAP